MQQLWLLKLTWNEILPSELSQQWEAFIDTLQYLETISVPRCVLLTSVKSIIVQGFADASSNAYGAVVYIFKLCPKQGKQEVNYSAVNHAWHR
ncbi:uncharacterized protein TNCT_248831 [Trichonephila clavata]|uniref:Uncharacterized protein n=1 Tax=Trichonephila clavata TaxID=2740835 RepID=A0A8X6FM24_TRICU|nr:uncharacterized protein TNCT_248831 [Trichonephila clavata]